jgi:hypothetical protein
MVETFIPALTPAATITPSIAYNFVLGRYFKEINIYDGKGNQINSENPFPVNTIILLAYTEVTGSPFTLTSAWVKVATITTDSKALRLAPVAAATAYDIEWCAVPAGHTAPTLIYGEPIYGGESFSTGLPIGDVYLKSASGQIAIVRQA